MGGTCWLAISSGGYCRGYERTETTFEDCCADVTRTRGWTEADHPTNGELFYWQLAGGAPHCVSCQRTCEHVKCTSDKRCRMRHGRPRCVCDPHCASLTPRHLGPVCGTDRRTYKSHCHLVKQRCRHGGVTTVDFYGRCQASCSAALCDGGKHCVQDQHGLPHCVHCPAPCPPPGVNERPVCGDDGVTYNSLCEFQRASCLSGGTITGLAYRAACVEGLTCDHLTCSGGKTCLMDPTTYRPRCISCHAPCRDIPGSPRICGTNHVTYHSYCVMRKLSCVSGIYVDTAHSGPCQ